MAAIEWSAVTAIAPGLAALDTVVQDGILAWANTYLSVRAFGGEDSAQLKMARIFLAAHLGELSPRSSSGGGVGVAGRVASITVSSTSETISFAQRSQGSGLELTEWGSMLAMMIRSNPAIRMPVTW